MALNRAPAIIKDLRESLTVFLLFCHPERPVSEVRTRSRQSPYRHARESGHPGLPKFPGFRLALAIATLAGMTFEICDEFLRHHNYRLLENIAEMRSCLSMS